MDAALGAAGCSARMLMQVHDELVFEAPLEETEATIAVVKRVMEEAPHPAATLAVPLQVEARAAQNWDEGALIQKRALSFSREREKVAPRSGVG